MFKIRKHRISDKHALDRRKLRENNYFFANYISEIGSDSIKRLELDNANFTTDAFAEFFHSGFDVQDARREYINGDVGTIAASIRGIKSFEIQGDYFINWSIQLDLVRTSNGSETTTGDCRFISVAPYIGSTIVSQAGASYHEMGFINNSDCSDIHRAVTPSNVIRDDSTRALYEQRREIFDQYGRWNRIQETDLSRSPLGWAPSGNQLRIQPSQIRDTGYGPEDDPEVRELEDEQYGTNTIHLSGQGYANMPRSSGTLGLVIHTQSGTVLEVESVNLSIRKRNK